MKFSTLFVALIMLCTSSSAQRLLSWTPEFPTDNGSITFTIDCSKGNQGLFNYGAGASNDVYVHVGVNTNLSANPGDWKHVVFTNFNAPNAAAKATSLGGNKYSYTITNIKTFFGVTGTEEIRKINCIFRSGDGSKKQVNSDGSDMYIPVYTAGQLATRFNLPPSEPRFIPWLEPISIAAGGNITTQAVSSKDAALTVKLNGNIVGTAAAAKVIISTFPVPTNCDQVISVNANDGAAEANDTVRFTILPPTVVAALPAGAIEGINYNPNNTEVTLVLFAPNKTSVSVIGDFNNWLAGCASQMKKTPDGKYWWTTISGLVPGQEYSYQYFVDNSIKIADPYAQKILDPFNDPFINAVTYPGLKPYPTGLTTDLVSVLQTAEPKYTWQSTGYTKPDKKNLMIYELLIRDFTAEHSYQSLIDSFQYFKNLGINTIELMPVNEFDGNESWGYNPAFYFAPDKYYGTKTKLKEFVDKCHLNGIAVILDVVYNHCTGAAPQAKLYWDAATNKPSADNPWLNVDAPHPYSVFNDFNHTSVPTQYLVQRSIDFWLDEYKIDGFRFDLAKGFTQTQTNATTVENYDATRVQNLNRYYDGTIANHPDAYMILEFLGTTPSTEEQAYATKGFMLWDNMNSRYNQNTLGFPANSNLSGIMYNSTEKAFSNPAAAVGYMESHDEERLMYKNLQFGNSNGTYNVKNLPTALSRMEAAAAVFFTAPGPKMIWQFGERGYDVPLNFGGSNVANKPPKWEYMQDANRLHLYNTFSSMIKFRLENPAIFNNPTFSYELNDGGGLFRRIQLQDPAANGKKVVAIANMDVTAQTRTITFQSAGGWSNFISNGTAAGVNGATGSTFNLTDATQTITLQPGEYHIYVSTPTCATPAPGVVSPVIYCQNTSATPLTATGTALLWYNTSFGGTGNTTAPTPSTTTIGSIKYYVSQTLNACEGPRDSITVVVTASTPAPTVTTPVSYCQGAVATPLTATGTNLKWYATATGGTGSSTAPTPSTAVVGSTNYYVSQTLSCGESPRALIVFNVTATPGAPAVTSPVNYCQGTSATPLMATGTNLMWYTSVTGGTPSSTAPTPGTSAVGTVTYYVSQSSGGCESVRSAIMVITTAIPTPPTINAPVSYCQNATAIPLSATGTNLLWNLSNVTTGGTSTAPTPSTATVGSTKYFVSQATNGCRSANDSITVIVTASTPAPSVTSPINYCQNATATALTATGTNLKWYIAATGGTGSTSAPTPSTTTVGSINFYVSQTQSCGESPRAIIIVNVSGIPTAPAVVSPVFYCQGSTATALTATGTNLKWYTTATGGTAFNIIVPSTNVVGDSIFYVSQSTSGCESPRAAITVSIKATPAKPAVTSPVVYCQNATAVPLVAVGTNLKWYTSATGGTGATVAPTPSTTVVGTTNFYVSQSNGICESARDTIKVAVNALPPAPIVSNSISVCQNSVAPTLSATGTNLKWYTVATGGTGTLTAPNPSTTTAGTFTFYVSQSNSCGEGLRADIVLTVAPAPPAPTALTANNITATEATLNWTGQSGSLYTLQYKNKTSSTWITVLQGSTINSFKLLSLSMGETYDWRVSANCDSSLSTNYVSAVFTTDARDNGAAIVRNGIGIKISPNPVTAASVINYSLTLAGKVNISVYTAKGQLTKKLFSADRQAGNYILNVTNDLQNLSAGTYFVRVEQNGKANTLAFIVQ